MWQEDSRAALPDIRWHLSPRNSLARSLLVQTTKNLSVRYRIVLLKLILHIPITRPLRIELVAILIDVLVLLLWSQDFVVRASDLDVFGAMRRMWLYSACMSPALAAFAASWRTSSIMALRLALPRCFKVLPHKLALLEALFAHIVVPRPLVKVNNVKMRSLVVVAYRDTYM